MAIRQIEEDLIANNQARAIYERIVLKMVRRYLKKHVRKVYIWVKENGTENVPYEILLDRGIWRELIPKIYYEVGLGEAKREYYNQRRLDGGEQKDNTTISMLVDIWSGKLRDFALHYAYNFESKLNDNTIKLIQNALGSDYAMGLDFKGRVRFFLKEMRDMVLNRSKPITRTETTTVAAIGKEIGAREWITNTGEQGYRVWFGRIERERPAHLELNDTIIPLDENYVMDGEICQRPGDVNLSPRLRINCRCSESFMTAGRYRQYVKRGLIKNGKIIG